MEEVLEDLLKARLISSPEKKGTLFGAYAPLSTFAAKIDVAYGVGVIGLATLRSLHLIRKLRNDFAHSSLRITFESDDVQNKLRELFKLHKGPLEVLWEVIKQKGRPEVDKIEKYMGSNQGIDKLVALLGWRGLFEILVSDVAAHLKAHCQDIETLA